MHNYTRILPGLLAAGTLLLPATPRAQNLDLSDTGMMLDGIAAVVNDGVVLISELEQQTALIVQRLQAENTPLPPRDVLVGQVLERLVVQQIQLQRAEREGIRMPDEVLNRALADIARRNGTTLAELPAMLAAEGVDYAAYRNEMREQLIVERLRKRDVVSRIGVTPRELEDYLEREQSQAHINNRYKISHILISLPANTTPGDVDNAKTRAWKIYDELLAGADFAQTAVASSDGQNALEGGSMGWRSGDSLPSLFVDIVPNMEEGQISEPIRSSSGFHIVKLHDIEGNEPILEDQTHVRHILLETDEIRDDSVVRQELVEIRAGIVEGDDFAAVAKAVSKDPGSAIEGGDMGWNGPGVFVPEFEEVMNSLDVGEISKPFQSPFGWHIVQVIDRRVHDTTEDVQRNRAMLAIRDSKVAEETELWLRQMRDESFVEYRM